MQITKTTFRGGPISSHPAIAPMLAATSIDLGQDSCAIDYLVFNAATARSSSIVILNDWPSHVLNML